MRTATRHCIMPDDYLPYVPDDILFEDDDPVFDDDIVMDLDDDEALVRAADRDAAGAAVDELDDEQDDEP